MKRLVSQLEIAEGRSEFIIALICDIRGFSQFSTVHESPDLAMFIRRFYLKLLQVYFKDAIFAKPTGDGLLFVFRYSEKSLPQVAEAVLSQCFQVLSEFPKMFEEDPMINFATPSDLGFGISRGTACCLFAKHQIIDYSGQLLNLAARLNDVARPRGIVLDGAFGNAMIPEKLRARFTKRQAYLKSIAEESPRDVLCSDEVVLPTYARSPLASHRWILEVKEFKLQELLKLSLSGTLTLPLKHDVLSPEMTKLQFRYPNLKLPGYIRWNEIRSYSCAKDAKGPHLVITLDQPRSIAASEGLPADTVVAFEFQYVPKKKAGVRRA